MKNFYSQTSITRSARDRRNPFEYSVVQMIEIRSFRIFSEKLGCFHRTSFATSTRVFREVIGTYVKALKKMSCLEVLTSSSLMLCRSKSAEKKIKAYIFIDINCIHVTASITPTLSCAGAILKNPPVC